MHHSDLVFIIQSNKRGGANWSGKEFSDYPAKIYSSFEECAQRLDAYWYQSDFDGQPLWDLRKVIIVPLTEIRKEKLLQDKKIRW